MKNLRRTKFGIAIVFPLVLVLLISLVAALAQPQPAAAATRATIVLDPDDNLGHVTWPGDGELGELPFNYRLAAQVQKRLQDGCNAKVVLTRDDSQDFVPLETRKARALEANPDMMVTLAFNTLNGTPWGVQGDGGPRSFARPTDTDFAQFFLNEIPKYTGRPATAGVGPVRYAAYADLPFPNAHVEALFLDHNFDYPVIKTGFTHVVDGVAAGIADELNAQGFPCTLNPGRPSSEELQRLRNLGYQSFLEYGADPVSMSTGNFVTSEALLELSGVGDQTIDTTITYNAQARQDSQVGWGWSFAYGASTQEYADGSVSVVLGDGRSFLFEADGDGGFQAPPGAFASLSRTDGGLRWRSTVGDTATFTVNDATGRGRVAAQGDRQGNELSFEYAGLGGSFPQLAKITDEAGQQVVVTSDDAGHITSLLRPDGARWGLAYTGAGDLESIMSPTGQVRAFTYDDRHQMIRQIGADKIVYNENKYDEKGRIVAQTNSKGNTRTLVYDDDEQTTTYTDNTRAVTVYHWDKAGRVTKVVDPQGHTTTTTYDSSSQPVTSTDGLKRTTKTAYDKSGQVSKVTDPSGSTTASTYNDNGDLTAETDKGGAGGDNRTTRYTVDSRGLPTVTTNPDGSTVKKSYDEHGDLVSTTDELGKTTTMSYDGRGNLVSTTDPNGHTESQAFDAANRLVSATDAVGNRTDYTYDADDHLTKVTYPNGSTESYTYNTNGQVASFTDRRHAVTSYTYDTELNLTATTLPNGGFTRNAYDKENRLIRSTDAEGGTTTYRLDQLGRTTATRDELGHTSSSTFNAAGEVTKATDADGAAVRYRLDARGLVTSAVAPNRGRTSYTYDRVGRVTSTTDPRGYTTKFAYDWRDNKTKQTDPAGHSTRRAYDPAGQLASSTDESGASTTYRYDAAGNLLRSVDDTGGATTYSYDAADRVTEVKDPNGHTDRRIAYDSMGQVTAESDALGNTKTFTYDASGKRASQTDALGHTTRYTYDESGHPSTTTDPLGRVTAQRYSLTGLRTTLVKPGGTSTAYRYDAAGNLTKVVDNWRPGKKANASTNVRTQYSYDKRDRVASIIEANKGRTRFSYDNMGQLTRETDPLGRKTKYAYDLAGNRTQRIAGNGTITNYTFNSRNELVRRTYSKANKSNRQYFRYTYTGLLRWAKNKTGIVSTRYDTLGRATRIIDAAGQQARITYDRAGNRERITLPGSRVTDYSYDAADRQVRQVTPAGAVRFSYDAAGRPVSTTNPNGTETTTAYDAAGQVTQKRTTRRTATLATFDYRYTADGHVAGRTQTVGKVVDRRGYRYDPLGRLTKSTGRTASSYRYDSVGDRIKFTTKDDPTTKRAGDRITQSSRYNKAGELRSSTTSRVVGRKRYRDVSSYRYDGSGNLVLATTKAKTPGLSQRRAYRYDPENLLEAAGPATKYNNVCGLPLINSKGCPRWLNDKANPGNSGQSNRPNTLRRQYDALGQLVYEQNAKTVTTWMHDGLNPVLATNSKRTTQFLRGSGGELLGDQTDNANARWYITDAQDSVVSSTNAAGTLRGTITYSDYGSQRQDSGYDIGFAGERNDPTANGLLNFLARSYLPSAGRWLQQDAFRGHLATPASLQRQQFVLGDPTSLVDVYGYFGFHPIQFIQDHKEAIVSVAVGVAVGVAVASACVSLVGCGPAVALVVAGVASGTASGVVDYVAQPGPATVGGVLKAAGGGALIGGATAFAGGKVGQTVCKVACGPVRAAASRVASAAKSQLPRLLPAARRVASRALAPASRAATRTGSAVTSVASKSASAVRESVSNGYTTAKGAAAKAYTWVSSKSLGATTRNRGAELAATGSPATPNVPVVTFSRSRAPGLARNYDDAVAAGAPNRLGRVDTQTRDANRRAALRGQAPAPAGQSLDEYPFACSAQGGCGSVVSAVPKAEQDYQGGKLSSFFQNNGIQFGDTFDVLFGP